MPPKRTYHKMKDRIRQIMEAQHMTQQVFASYIGTTPATLSGIFNDRTRPTINIIESIKKKFPDISLDWLMFGNGPMYQTPAGDGGAEANTPAPANSGQGAQESLFDFDVPTSPTAQSAHFSPQAAPYHNGVRNTHPEIIREEVKYVDKPARRVTEIRVYYDDQTWESFVPSKK